MDLALSRNVDEFVPRERWVASLSNGETIYEDARKGALPTWERLAAYCAENLLSITSLRLQIASTEVKLPSGQQGYIQKKVAWLQGADSGVSKCIGYVQDGLSLIYEVDSAKGSRAIRGVDPGPPWTIYKQGVSNGRT